MVIIYNNNENPFFTGWQESGGAKLWHISLKPNFASLPFLPDDHGDNPREEETPFSAYDLPSVEALTIYFHTIAGCPVKST